MTNMRGMVMKPSKYLSTCAKMAVLGRVFAKVVLEEHGANYKA